MFDLEAAKRCVEGYRGCGAPAQAYLADAVAEIEHLTAELAAARTEAAETDTFRDQRDQAVADIVALTGERDAMATECDRLNANLESYRERLREQHAQSQEAATFWHDRVVETLRSHDAIPSGLDVDGHPIEQIVGTCVTALQGERDRMAAEVAAALTAMNQITDQAQKSGEEIGRLTMEAARWKCAAETLAATLPRRPRRERNLNDCIRE